MNITKVTMNADGRHGGTVIETFLQSKNIALGTKLSVTINEEEHYFEVNRLSTSGGNLLIEALETGYWGDKLSRNKDFDIRSLIGLEVKIIDDPELIKKIKKQSCYC